MTKKDYGKFAAAIVLMPYMADRELVARVLEGVFTLDNPRFDRGKFRVACGLGKVTGSYK